MQALPFGDMFKPMVMLVLTIVTGQEPEIAVVATINDIMILLEEPLIIIRATMLFRLQDFISLKVL